MTGLTLDHLIEWYEECSIEKCSERSALALAEQAGLYFSVCLDRVGRPVENPDWRGEQLVATGTQSVCWQLLELRMNAGVHRSGKHYKDWLFEYSQDDENPIRRLSSLKSGLLRLMQATVRDYCAGLLSQRSRDHRYGVCSFDEARDEGPSAGDHYPGKAAVLLQPDDCSVDRPWIEQQAEMVANRIAEDMSARQCVVLLIKWCKLNRTGVGRISLDHDAALQAAGCGKSQLYAARNELDDYLKQQITSVMSENDLEEARYLLAPVVAALVKRIFLRMKSEKHGEPFLTFLERIEQ
jgi:hypothetical protein